MEARSRVVQLGIGLLKCQRSRDSLSLYRWMSSNTSSNGLDQFVRPTGKGVCVDALALANNLVSCGIPKVHAEAISCEMRNISEGILKNALETHLLKSDKEIVEIAQKLKKSELKFELKDDIGLRDEKIKEDVKKLRCEFNGLVTHLEAIKYACLKYCMGTLISMSVVGIGVLRSYG